MITSYISFLCLVLFGFVGWWLYDHHMYMYRTRHLDYLKETHRARNQRMFGMVFSILYYFTMLYYALKFIIL